MSSNDLGIDNIITTTESPESIFTLVEMLGEGSYGKVFKALNMQNNKYYAVKIVSTINGNLDELKKEISILKDCQSDYIVRYYGSYLYNEQLWLIMEYCDIGSVNDLMKATQRTLSEIHIACVLKGILQGLKYLHNSKKIHRDVKAGNILINKDGICKLADFGVSAEVFNTMGYIESFIGTPFWMSPEILNNKKYNKKTDIWSLGITAIEMAEGNPPNSQHKPYFAMLEIKLRPPQGLTEPNQWSQEFNRFVSKCLTIDPEKRPNAEELLLDPFILNNTTRINPQGILMNLVQENMESIRIFRKNLLKTQKFEAQEEKKKQPQQQNKKSDNDQQKNKNNKEIQDDKKNEKRLMTEFSQDYQDFVVNESGTIIEYQNYDEFSCETDQYQQFYKKSSPSQLRDNQNDKINNLIWENETGTMVEKIDDEDQYQKGYQNNNNNLKQQQISGQLKENQNVYANDNEEDQEDFDEQNNSVIIKEDHEIENIKGQAYSGVVQADSSQKNQQKVPDFVLFARQMEENAYKKMPMPTKNINVNICPLVIKKESPQQQSPSQEDEIPSECKNMNEQMIESQIETLKKELEREIKQLQESYGQKISRCEKALKIVKSKKSTSITSTSSQSIVSNAQPNQFPLNQPINHFQNQQNQEPISPIKRPLPHQQQIQNIQSPQSSVLQNKEYQQQSQSPLLGSSALPQFSQSPYIKSQISNNPYYDSNNNSNIMNSSTNNSHQIPPKQQNKTTNNSNNPVITSANNLLSHGCNNTQQNSQNTQNVQNPMLSNIYSDMPLPATPKTKEKQQINNFTQGIQTQPVSNNIYSNCMKDNQKNMPNPQQFTNGQSNQNLSHQQDDIINHIRRQQSNNIGKNDSTGGIANQQQKVSTQNVDNQSRKANNHPINLLNSSKNNQQLFEGSQILNKNQMKNSQPNNSQVSNSNIGLSLMTPGGGLSFEEALNRKNLLKQNQSQNNQNTPNNVVYDENSIYKFQLYMQQQQQDGGTTKIQSASPYLNPQIQTNTPNKFTNLEQQNILQQKSILNNNRQLPQPNNYNATERIQTEQSHQEFLALQAKKSKQYQQQNGIPQLSQQQSNNSSEQMKDNQYYRDNSIKLQQNQQSNNLAYNINNNNSSRNNNQIATQKHSVPSNQNNLSSNMIDNYSQPTQSVIQNQSSLVQNQQSSSTSSQVQQILSRSQNLQNNNNSTGSQKFSNIMNVKNNNSQEGNNSFLSNGQKSKNNNSYISNNHSNTNSIDEQKQYSNLNKNHLIVLQKKNTTPITSKDQSKSANNLSLLNQQQSQAQLKSQNTSSGISFKQLLNQQNERKVPQNNNYS